MPANPSPLQSLRAELASSSTTLPSIAVRFAANANSNASQNTYVGFYSSESLAYAEKLHRIFPEEPSRPALYGVPISIKDCFDVAGTVTTCGSNFYAQYNQSAAKNSWIAQRLLDCGAILTGKTHLHQLAYGITGENPDYGACLQPRDATLLTGGSSSGAAASVQEGSALAAIGTDTGGSIRIPSALCGLAGYRTSHGIGSGEEREGRWHGGYHLAQLAIGVLGVLVITGEYATGMIRSSLMAVPSRGPPETVTSCSSDGTTAFTAERARRPNRFDSRTRSARLRGTARVA